MVDFTITYDSPPVIDIRDFRIDLNRLGDFDRHLQHIVVTGDLFVATARKLGRLLEDTGCPP